MNPITLVHWGRTGAGPRFLWELANAAEDSGNVIRVVYNADSEIDPRTCSENVSLTAITTYNSKLGALFMLPKNFFRALLLRRELGKDSHLQVVSVMENLHQSLLLFCWLPRKAHYTTIIHDGVHHPGETSFLMRLIRRIELARANSVVALSSHSANQLRNSTNRLVIEAFHPVWSMVGTSSLEKAQSYEMLRIGFFGRLTAYKGLEFLPEIRESLVRSGISFRLSVHGDGPMAKQVQMMEGITTDIRWIPEDQINEVFKDLDLILIPYTEASQSGVIAQAVSSHVPYLVTPVGGLLEQLAQFGGGFAAESVSAEAISKTIVNLYQNPELLKKAIAETNTSVSFDSSWKKLFEIIRESGREKE